MTNINDTLKRINELAAKKKSGQELTPEELAEKKELYNIYLGFIKGQIYRELQFQPEYRSALCHVRQLLPPLEGKHL